MFKLSTSKEGQRSFSWIYFVHCSNVQMHQMHPVIFSSQCLPHLEPRIPFLSSLTGGSQLASSDKRQLREHGMKFLPLVSVGTLYLAYESANFKPISLRTTGAIWPWIQEQDSGFGVWSPQRVTYCHEQHLGVSGAANKPPVKLCRWVRLSSCYWRQARLYPHFRRLGRGLQKNDVRRRGRAPS